MITYNDTTAGIDPAQLKGFFDGWSNPPTPQTHLRLLERSSHVILALPDPREPVAGYIAALSDGVLSAYISHLEVRPSLRRQGIGSELVRRMLRKLQCLYMIDLLCDPELEHFYARFGLRPLRGMAIRNYENQSGSSSPSERAAC